MAGGGTIYDTVQSENAARSRNGGADRFALRRVDDGHWSIVDRKSQVANDVLAYISEVADEDSVTVSWCSRVPLRTRYATLDDVLTDLVEWSERSPGHSKPNRIPSYPPRR